MHFESSFNSSVFTSSTLILNTTRGGSTSRYCAEISPNDAKLEMYICTRLLFGGSKCILLGPGLAYSVLARLKGV